jgi:lambda family phage portal protein
MDPLRARYYESVLPSGYHPRRGGPQSADTVMERARNRLRDHARWLDENHDLAVGILDDLVLNIVGSGVGIEPATEDRRGQPLHALNRQLRDLWADFWEFPETSGELPGSEVERLICRSWLRDGEMFIRHVVGHPSLRYKSRIPYALELLEADFVPYDYTADNATHGVIKDEWGQPTGYVVYRQHPGELHGKSTLETRIIPAEFMTHLKLVKRLHQTRGVSVFHAVLSRLDDIKDYEESERIAARIAAAFTGFIKRNGDYDPSAVDPETGRRTFEMSPGMVFDDLAPGEDVGTIRSDRPNSGLEPFRDSQMRAVAAGTRTRFSSVSRNYNGTYSAQRQELVEGNVGYRAYFSYLRTRLYRQIWRRTVDTAILSGTLKLPRALNPATLYTPEIRQPAIPWIDPEREAAAYEKFIAMGVKSRVQIIRDIGGDPALVDAQLAADRFDARPIPDAQPQHAQQTQNSNEEAA